MSATVQDVAKKANVSIMTVSRALSGRDGEYVSPATRERVVRAARELDYQPNAVARSLRRRSTNIIGFYSSHGWVTPYDPFFAAIIHGLSLGCAEIGKYFLIYGHIDVKKTDDEMYADLTSGQIDGLIVLMHPDEPLVQRLAAAELPVVAIADFTPPIPSVVVDELLGSRLIAKHLAENGHKNILYWCGEAPPPDRRLSTVRRHEAFRAAASELGMTVVDISGVYDPFANRVSIGPEDAAWFVGSRNPRPTAVVCSDDNLAGDLLVECARLGIRVPEDLAVVGFDGCSAPAGQPRRLTTVNANWIEVVRTAVLLVHGMRDGMEPPLETVKPVDLVIGDTA